MNEFILSLFSEDCLVHCQTQGQGSGGLNDLHFGRELSIIYLNIATRIFTTIIHCIVNID